MRSSKRAASSAKRAVRSLTEIVPLDLHDSPFPKRSVCSSERGVPSSKRAVPSWVELVHSDLLDSPFPERAVPSKTTDGVGTGEARYAALAERSAQTADCLMRRVRRHRKTGR